MSLAARISIASLIFLTILSTADAARESGGRMAAAMKRVGIAEPLLHTSQGPSAKQLGGMDSAKDLKQFVPHCRGTNVTDLPDAYYKRYKMSDAEKGTVNRTATQLRKYGNIETALENGYLPSEGYEPGLGIALGNPDLIPASTVSWEKPSLLFYVKEHARETYRLTGAAYVAQGQRPDKQFRIADARSGKIMQQWRPWNKVCIWQVRGVLVYEDSSDRQSDCGGGKYIEQGWLLHLWLPLANPLGLFTPRNPGVDHVDLNGKKFSYCYE